MKRTVVFFDLETSGLHDEAEIIQLAAIAVRPDWQEAATFERKIQFDESKADPKALEKNHYHRSLWAEKACSPHQASVEFGQFLESYRTLEMVSKRTGNLYTVCRLAGYNSETFDKPRLWSMFKRVGIFLPADPRTLDVLQRVLWRYECRAEDLPNYQLATVARHLGIEYDGAHEGLTDVRMTIAIARALEEPWPQSMK